METTTTEITYRAVIFHAGGKFGKSYSAVRQTVAEAQADADRLATNGSLRDADVIKVEKTAVVTTYSFVEREA